MNDITKKVSVVMSVYGYREYIKGTVKSILEQTLEDFEFIIIDDGCNYDLPGIMREFNDRRIVYIKNPKNLGLTASLIEGVKKSKGKYIARIDAGNISIKNRLETQYEFLEGNSRYYLIGSSVELIDENGLTVCSIIASGDPGYIKNKLPVYNCINHSSIMFRNDGKAGYRKKFRYSQDYDFYLNMLSGNLILGNLTDVLSKERILPSSLTYSRKKEQEFFKSLARKFYFERTRSGSDSYDSLSTEGLPGAGEERKETGEFFYGKQKIYYLLFSGRTLKARKLIKNYLKDKFDLKLAAYFMVSFFPFIIRLVNKSKGLKYK